MIAGIGEYNTPGYICASSFTKAVTAYKSEVMYLKDIYLVLKDKEDEEMYVELFKYQCEITNRTLIDSGNSGSLANTVKGMPEEKKTVAFAWTHQLNQRNFINVGTYFAKSVLSRVSSTNQPVLTVERSMGK